MPKFVAPEMPWQKKIDDIDARIKASQREMVKTTVIVVGGVIGYTVGAYLTIKHLQSKNED